MKEHPLIMSAASIRAYELGTKTQTRRVLTKDNLRSWGAIKLGFHLIDMNRAHHAGAGNDGEYLKVPFCHPDEGWEENPDDDTRGRVSPKWSVGDRLWFKEAWQKVPPGDFVDYRADHAPDFQSAFPWQSPLFMPRAFARYTPLITEVRVQRLQDITEEDAVAEGVRFFEGWWLGGIHPKKGTPKVFPTARAAFVDVWDDLNAKRGYPWESNPWVAVIEFEAPKMEESE